MLIDILLAVILDILVGDPQRLPHPVRWIGALIAKLEQIFYPKVRSPRIDRLSGMAVVIAALAIVVAVSGLLLFASSKASNILFHILSVLIIYWSIAIRGLISEVAKVRKCLINNDATSARSILSTLVSRQVDDFDNDEIAKTACETLSENFVDAIIGPILAACFFGPIGAIAYRAINTLDSMLGYKNHRYEHFGYAAARLDDIVNIIPARISIFLIYIAGLILRQRPTLRLSETIRHARRSESPNSGFPEAAMASFLGIAFGGTYNYSDVIIHKEKIGPGLNEADCDILRQALLIMLTATMLTLLIMFCVAIRIERILI